MGRLGPRGKHAGARDLRGQTPVVGDFGDDRLCRRPQLKQGKGGG